MDAKSLLSIFLVNCDKSTEYRGLADVWSEVELMPRSVRTLRGEGGDASAEELEYELWDRGVDPPLSSLDLLALRICCGSRSIAMTINTSVNKKQAVKHKITIIGMSEALKSH